MPDTRDREIAELEARIMALRAGAGPGASRSSC